MASCKDKKLRVRLRFDIAPPSCPSCKCFMFLVDRDAARYVSDVEHTIAKKFGFSSPRYLVLSINDFVLLSSDDVEVIRDDDDIQVKIDHALKDDEQNTNADVVAVKTKSKKRICEDSNERPSKKVKKIEQTKLNKRSKIVEQRKRVVRKKKPKILKKIGPTPKSVESRPSKLKTPSVQSSESSSSDYSEDMLLKPHSLIKRQINQSSSSSTDSSDEKTKNISKTNKLSKPAAKFNLYSSVLKTKPKTQSLFNKNTSSSSEDTSSSDSDDVPNAKPQPPKTTPAKSNNVVTKQVQAPSSDSSSDSDSESDTLSVTAVKSNLSFTVSKLNPKTQPPISSSSDDDSTSDSDNEPIIATHKSTIPAALKPNVVVRQGETSSSDDDSDSGEEKKVLQSCKNNADNKVLPSQKNLINKSWENREKLNAMRAYPNYHNKSVVLTCSGNVNDKEIAMETESKPADAIAKPLVNDYSTLMSLSWPPRVKDKIAYQALEMSPIDYTPNVSEYKEAEVVNVSNDKQITVKILYQEKAPANLEVPGRFELVYEEEEHSEDQSEDDTITLDWTSLMNVKLIQ
uniref:coilin n=1 Tax=Ciona intestinalis TaxID=7719 RepID=UPI000180CEB8|nr:coilin [Ciona intestinalis]|eukprot:XP_002121518.1 coilin [Ciona intestinalis]